MALPLLLLLLQAAMAVMPATARASAPIRFVPNLVIAPPSSRCSRHWSVLGSSACRPSISQFAGDPLRTVAGDVGRTPPVPVRPVSPAFRAGPWRSPMTGRPVTYRRYELAESVSAILHRSPAKKVTTCHQSLGRQRPVTSSVAPEHFRIYPLLLTLVTTATANRRSDGRLARKGT